MEWGCVDLIASAVAPAAVESDVLYQRLAGIHREPVVQKEGCVPADGPGVVLPVDLSAQHAGKGIVAVEIKLCSVFFIISVKCFHQG